MKRSRLFKLCRHCSKTIRGENVSGFCRACYDASRALPPRQCSGCKKQIEKQSVTGQCRTCLYKVKKARRKGWLRLRKAGLTIAQIGHRTNSPASTIGAFLVTIGVTRDCSVEKEAWSVAEIERCAASAWRVFDVAPGAIWTATRVREIVKVRRAVWLLARERGVSYAALGRAFELDHTVTMIGVRRAQERCAVDTDYAERVEKLRAMAYDEAVTTETANYGFVSMIEED